MIRLRVYAEDPRYLKKSTPVVDVMYGRVSEFVMNEDHYKCYESLIRGEEVYHLCTRLVEENGRRRIIREMENPIPHNGAKGAPRAKDYQLWSDVDFLRGLGVGKKELAEFLGVSVDTLKRRFSEEPFFKNMRNTPYPPDRLFAIFDLIKNNRYSYHLSAELRQGVLEFFQEIQSFNRKVDKIYLNCFRFYKENQLDENKPLPPTAHRIYTQTEERVDRTKKNAEYDRRWIESKAKELKQRIANGDGVSEHDRALLNTILTTNLEPPTFFERRSQHQKIVDLDIDYNEILNEFYVRTQENDSNDERGWEEEFMYWWNLEGH